MIFQYLFFFIIYPAALYLSIYLGGFYAKKRLKLNKIWKSIGLESSLVSIYALLLSFSLVLSSNHAADRNDEIYAVADKLSILVKKSKYYDEPLKNHLQSYLKAFFQIHHHNLKAGGLTTGEAVSKIIAIDQKLDQFLIIHQKTNPETRKEIDELTTYISNLRSTYIRLTENYNQSTPTLIISILIVYSLLIGFLIGFMTVIDNNQTYVLSAIFLFISVIMVAAIWDQDHPNLGFIQPNYQSITDVSNIFSSYLKNQ
ncbi:MAG: hypothetical protein EOP00_14115 [Pedobacter sp.]|nr:MAG: hypothetical protein EOP00_14115 [Pedobacter sp.]